MNRSQVLKALEWVDRAAREGDMGLLAKARMALEAELVSRRNTQSAEEARRIAFESFVRKHGRDPLEDIADET